MKRKVLISLVFMALLVVLLSGCGATGGGGGGPIPTYTPSCSLQVVSSCYDCWGYVWVNGSSTGQYIDLNSSVTISNVPCNAIVAVELRDQYGNVSHPEYIQTHAGVNLVNFTYW